MPERDYEREEAEALALLQERAMEWVEAFALGKRGRIAAADARLDTARRAFRRAEKRRRQAAR